MCALWELFLLGKNKNDLLTIAIINTGFNIEKVKQNKKNWIIVKPKARAF